MIRFSTFGYVTLNEPPKPPRYCQNERQEDEESVSGIGGGTLTRHTRVIQIKLEAYEMCFFFFFWGGGGGWGTGAASSFRVGREDSESHMKAAHAIFHYSE